MKKKLNFLPKNSRQLTFKKQQNFDFIVDTERKMIVNIIKSIWISGQVSELFWK